MTKDVLIRQYLLGSLAQDERARLEDQYFADTALFEELIAVENLLIDSYVRQELSPPEMKQFEAEFLSSPQRRARVEFARDLRLARHEFPPLPHNDRSTRRNLSLAALFPGFSNLQWASVAAAVLLVAAGVWYFFSPQLRNTSPGSAVASHGMEKTNPPSAASAQGETPDKNASMAMSEAPVTFTPEASTTRSPGNGGNELNLPAKPTTIVFRLSITGKTYQEYRAQLQTVEGQKIAVSSALAAQESGRQALVTFRVLSTSLEPRDYVLRLQAKTTRGGWGEIEAYSFRAVSK